MVTKPRYRQKLIRDVVAGDRVYNPWLEETILVTRTEWRGCWVTLDDGITQMRHASVVPVWVEVPANGD